MSLLQVDHLDAFYGSVQVLQDVSFSVDGGAIVSILGANGAGKTTLLRALSGLVRVRGAISFDGRRIDGKKPFATARTGVGHVPEGRGTFTGLTVEENLRVAAFAAPRAQVSRGLDEVYTYFAPLRTLRYRLAGGLSGGEQQMLAIGRALMMRPRLLLLDEPSQGLAPQITENIFGILQRLNAEEHVTMLLVEQNASLALRLATFASVLETGRMVLSGPADVLQHDENVRRAYSGISVESFLQLVASGIATGIIYGSLGLAFVLVFQATRTLNLAQGEIAALGTFGAWTLLGLGLPYWLVFVLMMAASFVGGFVIHRFLIRPLDGKSHFSVIVVTLALLLGINGLDLFIWGGDLNKFPTPFGQRPINLAGVIVNSHDLGTIGVLAAVLVLLYLLMERTSIGLVLRATAQNRVSAELIGIPTDLAVGVGWGVACALGTIAGILAAPVAFLEPGMMINLLPYALAAITLGGLTSPVGALVGGILVGVFENLVGNYVGFIGQDLKLPVVLLLMAIVLLFRPQGLFGRLEITRV